MNDHYEGKTVAILGAKTTIGKVLLRKIFVSTKIWTKIKKLILLDVKNFNNKKEVSVEDYFLDENLFTAMNMEGAKEITQCVEILVPQKIDTSTFKELEGG